MRQIMARCWATVVLLLLVIGLESSFVDARGGGRDDPVMAGYDLVAYHQLEDPIMDGVPGSDQFQLRYKGYLYYFSSEANLKLFQENPTKYLPKYGGFCAWGVAWEYPEDGWPWARHHMGPPCGPRDGWALLEDQNGEKHLYCSIWRSYQDDFNRKQEEGIALADARWIEWYGSLDSGPMNNGCYAWNWQECFAQSIYDPDTPLVVEGVPTIAPTDAPTQSGTLFGESLEEYITTSWSDPILVMEGAATFKWSLEDVTSIRPLLLVDLVYAFDREDVSMEVAQDIYEQYIGFGVAEHVMQGALVVCSPKENDGTVTASKSTGTDLEGMTNVDSLCTTYLGSGMAISQPPSDPVQPTVRMSAVNETHYHVRFAANLFACWANPVWPARALFSRGMVSGNGDPLPHRNVVGHRQAIQGVEFLSVVQIDDDAPENLRNTTSYLVLGGDSSPPGPLELEPLPNLGRTQKVDNSDASVDILDGRVTLKSSLWEYGPNREQVIQIKLQNVPFDDPDDDPDYSYIGFGLAPDTMSGLIITCSPTIEPEATAICSQWRGLGTNLYPLTPSVDAGGWHLLDVQGNGTLFNYTIAGRVSEVLSEDNVGSVRAIAAIGHTAPDTGTPLMHASSRDRTPVHLENLSGIIETAAVLEAKSASSSEESVSVPTASISAASGVFGITICALSFAVGTLMSLAAYWIY